MSILSWGNPYTHEEYTRECVSNRIDKDQCPWCGNKPDRLYKYNNNPGYFCNIKCYKAYYD